MLTNTDQAPSMKNKSRNVSEEDALWRLRTAIELGDWADLSAEAAKLWAVLVLFGATTRANGNLESIASFAGITVEEAHLALEELISGNYTSITSVTKNASDRRDPICPKQDCDKCVTVAA